MKNSFDKWKKHKDDKKVIKKRPSNRGWRLNGQRVTKRSQKSKLNKEAVVPIDIESSFSPSVATIGAWSSNAHQIPRVGCGMESPVIGNRFTFSHEERESAVFFLLFSSFPFLVHVSINVAHRNANRPFGLRIHFSSSSSFPRLLPRSMHRRQRTPLNHPARILFGPVSSVCPRRIYMRRRGGLFSEWKRLLSYRSPSPRVSRSTPTSSTIRSPGSDIRPP